MSNLEKDELFQGIFSNVGKVSAKHYNIFGLFKNSKNKSKNKFIQDNFLPDKEWEENLTKEEAINKNEILNGCKFNTDELNSEIKNNNIYYKGEISKGKKNEKKINNRSSSQNNKDSKNSKIIKKKFKYHDSHMQKIEKYKKEGFFQKMNNQQDAFYYPNLDFIKERIISGPQWKKLTGREELLDPDNNKINSVYMTIYKNKNNKYNNRLGNNNKTMSNNICPKIYKCKNNKILKNKVNSAKFFNSTTKSLGTFSRINNIKNNNNKNNYLSSSYNLKDNIKTISCNQSNYKNQNQKELNSLFILKNPRKSILNKEKYKSVPDFDKYIDNNKLKNKVRRNRQITRLRVILHPNYSSIEERVKTLAKYYKKSRNINEKNKKIEFNGISSNELLYDACGTFDKIYGNKFKSVPKFKKMTSRPNDINLPTYMKGLYNRLGIELNTDKTLQMNNYEKSKLYNFEGYFNNKNNKYNYLKRVYFEDEINNEKNKIQKDLDLMKTKFKNLHSSFIEY